MLRAWSLILISGCAFGSISLATKISVNQLRLYNYIKHAISSVFGILYQITM